MKKILFAFVLCLPVVVQASPPRVTDVKAREVNGAWTFSVSIEHPDSGWDHYADGWEVTDADGNVLGTRVLFHPHVNEQPFTRSLSGVTVPDDMDHVFIRAQCNVTGKSETLFAVDLR